MSTIPQPRFYVYALARPFKKEWKIFYIGKGTKRRVFAHEDEARRGFRSYRHNVIRKVWREGGEIQRYILLTTDNEEDAFEYEKEMIALHGRENLCNMTDGGDGVRGYNMPQSVRDRISAGVKAYCNSPEGNQQRRAHLAKLRENPEHKANFSNAIKAHWQNPEYYARVRKKMNEAIRSPEHRAKASEQGKARWATPSGRARMIEHKTPEFRALVSNQVKEHWKDPEYRENISQKVKSRWNDPEYRQKVTDKIRASQQEPGFKEKMSAAMKACQGTPEAIAANRERGKRQWQDPDLREKRREMVRALWQDPEYRAKMLAARAKKK